MRAPDDADSLDQATSEFLTARPRLFGIAYRMLGSVVEAEDIVRGGVAALAEHRPRRDPGPGRVPGHGHLTAGHQSRPVRAEAT